MKLSRFLSSVTAASLALAAGPVSAAGSDTADTGPSCELHISGAGWPNRVAKLAEFQRQKDSEAREPLSPKHVYGAVYRAHTLDDDIVRALLPNAGRITIVKHVEMLDLDRRPLSKVAAPLYPSASECVADLVLTSPYGIFPRPGGNPYGVVGEVIAGGSRLVSSFWFRASYGGHSRVLLLDGRFDSPLPATPAGAEADLGSAVATASNDNLRQFVRRVVEKSRD